MFLHNTKQHEAMPTEFVAIKAIEKQKQEMHCNQNEIDLKTNRYRNKKGFKIKKLNEISLKIYNNSPPCCLLRLNCSRDANFPAFFPFLVKTRRHRSADLRELGKYRARSIQPNFPEISVQNSMDRFGPTGKVSKKRVHLLRWSSFFGRTGLNFGRMDRAHKYITIVVSINFLQITVP